MRILFVEHVHASACESYDFLDLMMIHITSDIKECFELMQDYFQTQGYHLDKLRSK